MTESEDDSGWWETSTGAEFGSSKRIEIKILFNKLQAELLKARELAMVYGSQRQAQEISDKYGIPMPKGHPMVSGY